MTFLAFFALMVRYASPESTPGLPLSTGLLESLLGILAGAVVGPMLTTLLKRLPWIDEQLGAAVNLVATLGLYAGAWWLVTGGDRAALELYLTMALAAAGLGGAANNVWRKRMMSRG